jgi:hypothetical protein
VAKTATQKRPIQAGNVASAKIAQGKIMFECIKQLAETQGSPRRRTQPPPEEDLGGGDICSLQEQPSTDDDQPLD